MNTSNYIALIETSLVTALIGRLIFIRFSTQNIHKLYALGVFILIFVILLIPIYKLGTPWNLPFVYYIRGATGDLSITSLVFFMVGQFVDSSKLHISRFTPILIFLIGIVFYPLALGISMHDPYPWGYSGTYLVISALIVAAIFWLKGYLIESFAISLAITAWCIEWHESTNLWDYLLDPFLVAWCAYTSIKICIARLKTNSFI